jgi:hypothetical protein
LEFGNMDSITVDVRSRERVMRKAVTTRVKTRAVTMGDSDKDGGGRKERRTKDLKTR